MERILKRIYQRLYACFGPQRWWPAESPFEVMVGAILTQNTSWSGVEKAIANLKKSGVLTPAKLSGLPEKKLARVIRPAGYFNLKAKRLRNFLGYYRRAGGINSLRKLDTPVLRRRLLSLNGIGPETADSMLLYALNRPVFVADAYTKRIFSRHRLLSQDAVYQDTQNLFMQNLKKQVKLFNEYHALLVRLGKEFCLKTRPRCEGCPLNWLGRRRIRQ